MKYKDGSFRHNRSISIMEKVINDFILENKMSGVLTTIMDIHFPPRGETANIYLSVFPDKKFDNFSCTRYFILVYYVIFCLQVFYPIIYLIAHTPMPVTLVYFFFLLIILFVFAKDKTSFGIFTPNPNI